ncbi:MAG: GTP cyclohydrolase MptA [Chloroflexota bacterium]|nr:GTP cyclohydrolase MptA [Chloroflexota bacterium]
MSRHTVYIGIGSNLGDKQANITEALQQLRSQVSIRRVASLYDTDPVGYTEQPRFLNTVIEGETELEPHELLTLLKGIERRLGRQQDFRNAPRPIDMDILFHGDALLDAPELTIPHPQLHERAFVLEPLAELAPNLCHPRLGMTVSELLARVDTSGVRRTRAGLAMRLARDVQGEAPEVSVALSRVGITDVRKVIRLGRARPHSLQAEISLYADIGARQKGLHMSRFSHALDTTVAEAVQEDAPDVESLAARIAERVVQSQGALRSEVRIRAGFSLRRYAPVSGLPTDEMYTLLGIAVCRPEHARRMVGIEAEGMTACPCAQDMIDQHSRERLEERGFQAEEIDAILEAVPTAAHSQRSRATLLLGTQARVRAEDLVEIAESSMSSENYGLLKRPDEFFVVHKAHRRPRFVEDVAREMLRAAVNTYVNLPGEDFLFASVKSFESIHKHDAYAEGGGTLTQMRGQILRQEAHQQTTTLEKWLG